MAHGGKLTEKVSNFQGRQNRFLRLTSSFDYQNEEGGSHAALDDNSLTGLLVLNASRLRQSLEIRIAQTFEERRLL